MKKYVFQILTLFALIGPMMFIQAAAPTNMLGSLYAQDGQEGDHNEEDEGDDEYEGVSTLPIKSLNFSVIKKGRVRGTVSIVPVLVILNSTDDEIHELTALLPLIRSDLMAVANLLAKRRFRVNRPIDPDFVAKYFQNRMDQRLGKNRIKIYIQDAIIRPIK